MRSIQRLMLSGLWRPGGLMRRYFAVTRRVIFPLKKNIFSLHQILIQPDQRGDYGGAQKQQAPPPCCRRCHKATHTYAGY